MARNRFGRRTKHEQKQKQESRYLIIDDHDEELKEMIPIVSQKHASVNLVERDKDVH